jgi:Flp pilus assembly protein TadD, contains TPR repeats
VLIYARRYSEAVTELNKALDLDPTNLLARVELGHALTFLGKYNEAAQQFSDAIDVEAGNDIATAAWSYGLSGNQARAKEILSRLEQRSRQRYITEPALAVTAIGAGNNSLALDYLEKGLANHSFYLIFLPVDGRYDPVKRDPRFQHVIREVQKNY